MTERRDNARMHPIEAALLGALGGYLIARIILGEGVGLL